MLNFCPDCMEGWNPVFAKVRHKPYCKLDAELHSVPPEAFCSRCGSGRKGERGEILHQEWCSYRESPDNVGGTCPRCYCAVKEGSPNSKIVHRPYCVFYETESSTKPFKTDFSEIKTMSVDGLIMRASKIAAEAHKSHTRWWSGDPYILHNMRVAGRVMLLMQSTPLEIATAWLNDVLKPFGTEDPPMTTDGLADRGMPRQVIDMVVALTSPSNCLAKGQTLSAEKLRDMDLKWFKTQAAWIKRIKLLVRIDNLTELSWKDKDYMSNYCADTKKLLEAIGDADPVLAEEANHIIEYYEKELLNIAVHQGGWE